MTRPDANVLMQICTTSLTRVSTIRRVLRGIKLQVGKDKETSVLRNVYFMLMLMLSVAAQLIYQRRPG